MAVPGEHREQEGHLEYSLDWSVAVWGPIGQHREQRAVENSSKMLVSLALVIFAQGPAALSLLPTQVFPTCLTNPVDLIPDPVDCHIFYQCDLNPQPMSCGNMMFNSFRQVCDWPSTVLQLRPECRNEEQFTFSNQKHPGYSGRTLRMLNLFGDGDRFSQKRLRAPQDVGRGRRRNFGNREYFEEEAGNMVDDNAYMYEDEEAGDFVEKEYEAQNIEAGKSVDDNEYVYEDNEEEYETKHIEAGNRIDDNEYVYADDEEEYKKKNVDRSHINFDEVLQEIQRRLPQVVQNSLSQHEDKNVKPRHEVQAVSTPADTIRLEPKEPSYVFEPVYPSQAPPAPTPLIIQSIPARNLVRQVNIPQAQNYRQVSQEYHNQPKLAPILVEDTREIKPVWTVTRERPQQIQRQQQQLCADKNCGKQRHRVLRKIKRKLIVEEKQQPQERRNEFIQETEAFKEDFQVDVEKSYNIEDEKALTLKEAYDRAIRKVDQINKKGKEVKGNLLNEILNRDFGESPAENYVNSDDLRFFDQ